MSISRSAEQIEERPELTSRQREIIEYLGLGCTNQEISKSLGISINTVKVHVAALYKELGVGNRTEAVHRYRQLFVIDADAVEARSSVPAVAILPFDSQGLESGLAGEAKGLSDSVTLRLLRWARFPVIAQEACASHSPNEVKNLERLLGATYAVLGSLRMDGGRLRAGVRLLDTSHGRVHWAQVFDLPDAAASLDLDAVGAHIVAALMPELVKAEFARTESRPPCSWSAWDLVLRGLHTVEHRAAENCLAAIDLFEASIAQAPEFALAHSSLVFASYLCVLEQWGDNLPRAVSRVHEHARRCLGLDPSGADTSLALALSRILEGQIDQAIGLLFESVRVNPCSISSFSLLGQLHAMKGVPEEGCRFVEECVRLSEHTAGFSRNQGALALMRFAIGDYVGAATASRDGLLYDFGNTVMLAVCIASTALAGDLPEARRLAASLRRIHPDFSIDAMEPFLKNVAMHHCELFKRGLADAGLLE